MRNLDESDLPSPQPEFLEQELGLKTPQSGLAVLLPHTFQRPEACRSKLPSRLRKVQASIRIRLCGLASPDATEPIEFVNLGGC